MPVNHQLYSEWDSARFLKWASGIGISTRRVVQKMFDTYHIEEQAYKGCLSLLKLMTNILLKGLRGLQGSTGQDPKPTL